MSALGAIPGGMALGENAACSISAMAVSGILTLRFVDLTLEEVLGVLVECELSDLLERVVGVRPRLGDVEGDVTSLLGLLRRHSLDVHDPRWEVTALDSVEHVDHVVVRVNTSKTESFCRIHVLDAAMGLEVYLDIGEVARGVRRRGLAELVGVVSEAVDVAKRLRLTAAAEEMHQGVDTFLVVVVEVPEHVGIWHICLRVTLVCSVHAWKLDRIADEENW